MYLSLPKQDRTIKNGAQNQKEKGEQKSPVAVKGFQCSYIRNVRAGAFHRGKMQSSAFMVLAPAETRGDQALLPWRQATAESFERCLPL